MNLLGGGQKSSFQKGSLIFHMFTLKCLLPLSVPFSPIHCHYSRAARHLAQTPRKGSTWFPASKLNDRPVHNLLHHFFFKHRSYQVTFDFTFKALVVPSRKC